MEVSGFTPTQRHTVKTYRFGKVSVAALIFLSVISGLIAALFIRSLFLESRLAARSQIEEKLRAAAAFSPDLVFIGASQTEMGINPIEFDAIANSMGLSVRSFNIAVGALNLVEMRYMSEKILRETCCIKYFIMSPCFECINSAIFPNTDRAISFMSAPNAIRLIRYLEMFKVIPEQGWTKLAMIANVLMSMARHYSNLGVYMGMGTPQFNQQDNELQTANWSRSRGHSAFSEELSGVKREQYIQAVDRDAPLRAAQITAGALSPNQQPLDLITDAMFGYFIDLVTELQAKGIHVIVITPPETWNWQLDAELVTKYRSRCRGVPILDFGDINANKELFLPATIRVDSAHMNETGAQLWSQSLARRFVDLSKAGLLEQTIKCDPAR